MGNLKRTRQLSAGAKARRRCDVELGHKNWGKYRSLEDYSRNYDKPETMKKGKIKLNRGKELGINQWAAGEN